MRLAPFGVLKKSHIAIKDAFVLSETKFSGTELNYQKLVTRWLGDVEDKVWPAWQDRRWSGGAAEEAETATAVELDIMVKAFMVDEMLEKVPVLPNGLVHFVEKTHRWHYQVEDGVVFNPSEAYPDDEAQNPDGIGKSFEYRSSRGPGANFIAYSDHFRVSTWQGAFFSDLLSVLRSVFIHKEHFMRPRPWAAAALLGTPGFKWETGANASHTGVHPALPSGHCSQGLMGACGVVDQFDDLPEPILARVAQYGVDFGDRRVFAGVHYMTDNIASWLLVSRLIPFMYQNPERVRDFAARALRQSAVYQVIQNEFDGPLAPALELLNEEFPMAGS